MKALANFKDFLVLLMSNFYLKIIKDKSTISGIWNRKIFIDKQGTKLLEIDGE